MALKNPDGSIYRISTPNPLMKSQEIIDISKLVFYNLNWEAITFNDNSFKEEELKPEEVETEKQEIDIDKTEVEEEVVLASPKQENLPEKPSESEQIKNSLSSKNVVIMHCQLATIKTTKDELYGESYNKTEYGNKFTFEGIPIERGDLEFQFWTNLELTPQSVVYPKKYRDGSPFGDFRWWKVVSSVSKSGGYLVDAIISNYQPDFSD